MLQPCTLGDFASLEMFIDPAVFNIIPAVEVLHVWLNVKKRRAVQNIDFRESNSCVLYAFNLHDGKSNMIRSVRASNREYPMLNVLKERFSRKPLLL